MITARILSGQVQSNSKEAFGMLEKSRFGEKNEDVVIYMPVEALFLIKNKKMILEKKNKVCSYEQAHSDLKKLDSKIDLRFSVFSDLRKKGFTLKTGLKFGGDFRVYDRGTNPNTAHARWILVCQKDSLKIDWSEFSSKNRVAHSTNKKILFALIDQENNPNYYEVGWMRL